MAAAGKSQLFSTSVIYAPAGKLQLSSSIRSTLWQLRLESRSFAVQVSVVSCSIRSTLWQLQRECSTQTKFWQLQGRLQSSWLDSAWRLMSWVSVGHRFGYRFGPANLWFRNLGLRQQLGPDVCLHGFWWYRFFPLCRFAMALACKTG